MDVRVNISKDFIDNYLPILIKIISSSIEQKEFVNLKMSEILPIFKKKVLNKDNYRPVSLLPYMSKVFEKLLHKQIEIS